MEALAKYIKKFSNEGKGINKSERQTVKIPLPQGFGVELSNPLQYFRKQEQKKKMVNDDEIFLSTEYEDYTDDL